MSTFTETRQFCRQCFFRCSFSLGRLLKWQSGPEWASILDWPKFCWLGKRKKLLPPLLMMIMVAQCLKNIKKILLFLRVFILFHATWSPPSTRSTLKVAHTHTHTPNSNWNRKWIGSAASGLLYFYSFLSFFTFYYYRSPARIEEEKQRARIMRLRNGEKVKQSTETKVIRVFSSAVKE